MSNVSLHRLKLGFGEVRSLAGRKCAERALVGKQVQKRSFILPAEPVTMGPIQPVYTAELLHEHCSVSFMSLVLGAKGIRCRKYQVQHGLWATKYRSWAKATPRSQALIQALCQSTDQPALGISTHIYLASKRLANTTYVLNVFGSPCQKQMLWGPEGWR